MDQEKAHDMVPELWFCMRESGVAEKNVRLMQDMYEQQYDGDEVSCRSD